MKAFLGDTVAVDFYPTLKSFSKEEMNNQLREQLIWLFGGAFPKSFVEEKRYVTLTTQEMVDEYNATGKIKKTMSEL